MWKLSRRSLQEFEKLLGDFHQLFSGCRCEGIQTEELLFRSINADPQAPSRAHWQEGGHDDEADIIIRDNGHVIPLQVKSGRERPRGKISLSGHRLGRFSGDVDEMSAYLNRPDAADIILLAYQRVDGEMGRRHIYKVGYLPIEMLRVVPENWLKSVSPKGAVTYRQINQRSIHMRIVERLSWQVWWEVPISLIEWEREMSFG